MLGAILLVAGFALAAPGASISSSSHAPGAIPAEQRAGTRDGSHAPAGQFRSRVDLVTLDVWVEGSDARFVPNLTPTDFLVLEDGRPQELSLFVPEGSVPLAVLLLVDRSGSMAGAKLENAQAAAIRFIQGLGPRDMVGVMAFDDEVSRLAPIGRDHRVAARAVADLTAHGRTGLYDALAVGLHELATAALDGPDELRRALVVLSDGEDTASVVSFEGLVDRARRTEILVYGISLRTNEKGRALAPPFTLAELSRVTGGRAVAAVDPGQLVPIYDAIGIELRSLYRIGYTSRNARSDGRWRTLSVRVGREGLKARSRAGYFAPRAARGKLMRR